MNGLERLDLSVHSPDEYEGKLLTLNDASYRVGSYLGEHENAPAHMLLNARSGLCLHVVVLPDEPRRLDPARIHVEAMFISDHGGVFEIYPYDGPYESDDGPTGTMLGEADELLEQERYAEALELLDRALQINQSHTVALHNSACALRSLDQIGEAAAREALAVAIEPNSHDYLRQYVHLAAFAGLLRSGVDSLQHFAERFPRSPACHSIGARLCIKIGRPDMALALLDQIRAPDDAGDSDDMGSTLKDLAARKRAPSPMAELRREAQDGIAANDRAAPHIRRSIELKSERRYAEATAELEAAVTEYPDDPYLHMNLGLAYATEGRWAEAIPALVHANQAVRRQHQIVCNANAAYCMIGAGDHEAGFGLLELTLEPVLTSGLEPDAMVSQLPTLASWCDPGGPVHEHQPRVTVALLEHALDAVGHQHAPPVVARVYNLLGFAQEQLDAQ